MNHDYSPFPLTTGTDNLSKFMVRVIIGYNQEWKQESSMGARNKQAFISIPHLQLIRMIQYKAQLAGIDVVLTEESYTSRCSALDNEPIGKNATYIGKRVIRGLFHSSKGIKINADVNAAMNILRKVVPTAFTGKGIAAMVLSPELYKFFDTTTKLYDS
ncbi:MAG: zinc ribbon domain-containing protein [Promethearchaeota archaeon]